MILPSASQGANNTPTNGNIDIILQNFVDCIDEEGIYLELCCCKPSGALEIVQRCKVPFLSLVMSFTIVGCLIWSSCFIHSQFQTIVFSKAFNLLSS